MQERGYAVDHSTVQRWVVHYAPRIEKAFRENKKRVGLRWRLEWSGIPETYLKIKGEWKYLYRAFDKQGNTIDFLLTARRDKKAALRFLNKAIGTNGKPSLINIDKSGANTTGIRQYNVDENRRIKIRQYKYLNNIVEQVAGGAAFRPSIYQTNHSPHAWFQFLPVSTSNLGGYRALAYAEERPKQEFAVGVGAVLRTGGYRIIASDLY